MALSENGMSQIWWSSFHHFPLPSSIFWLNPFRSPRRNAVLSLPWTIVFKGTWRRCGFKHHGWQHIFHQILDKPHLFLAELQDPSNQSESLRVTFGSYNFYNSSCTRRQLSGRVEDLAVDLFGTHFTPQLYQHKLLNLTCYTGLGRMGGGTPLRKPKKHVIQGTLLVFEQRPAWVLSCWVCFQEGFL